MGVKNCGAEGVWDEVRKVLGWWCVEGHYLFFFSILCKLRTKGKRYRKPPHASICEMKTPRQVQYLVQFRSRCLGTLHLKKLYALVMGKLSIVIRWNDG